MLSTAPTMPDAPATRWQIFSAAPHRLMFCAGTLQILAALAWWLAQLGARAYAAPLAWSAAPAWIHATLMVYGVFVFFVFGFLMTALPKWIGAKPVARADYLPAWAMLCSGWALFHLGIASAPQLLTTGLAVATAGILTGWLVLRRSLASRPSRRIGHPDLVLWTLPAAAFGMLLMAVGLATTSADFVEAALEVGLWAYLLPAFAIVAHRMLPAFTSMALNCPMPAAPMGLLYAMLAAALAHGLLAVAAGPAWTWPADVLLGAASLKLLLGWKPRHARSVPLLWSHYLAFGWLPLAAAMLALQSGAAMAGLAVPGGHAALHALGLGFFASILAGMMTRVTRGHSGRSVYDDRHAWPLFLLLQLATVLRVAAEFLPGPAMNWTSVAAAAVALLAYAIWAAHHLPMYFAPRADGQPG